MFFAGSSYVKDILLSSFHSRYVLIERCQFTLGLGAVYKFQESATLLTDEMGKLHCPKNLITRKLENYKVPLKSEQFCQTISVGGILNDTKFDGFSKLIPELGVLTFLLIDVR